jgi:hypothetical protein
MNGRLILALTVASCCPPQAAKPAITTESKPIEPSRGLARPDEPHLANLQQLTYGGDNAEAYWSFSGDQLIFQTNRTPYKCDQIEIMPATAGASAA